MTAPLRPGLDVLLEDPWLVAGRRAGLLANPASVTSRFVPALRALRDVGVAVTTLFGPEHGVAGAAQAMEPVRGGPAKDAPRVVSLYGATVDWLSPRPVDLEGLEVVICDLPDVGSRYYTFVWTTALMMQACATAGIPVVLLDRPNPLGGFALEGNLPVDRFLSFVGLHPLPVRHGMTPGEIARWVNNERGIGCDLTVIPMKAGTHPAPRRRIGETPFWVIPSPNMPTRETALVYPGTCLVEGTNLSEGRGTSCPFEVVGAPWLDATEAADAANALGLPGVVFRPHTFRPTFQKHAGLRCGGVQPHVTDPETFRPYETGLRLLERLRSLDVSSFQWRTEPYEFRDDVPAIDLLAGTNRYRLLVDEGRPLDDWIATFPADLARFAPSRERSLLYRAAPKVVQVVGAHESGKTTLAVALIAALSKGGWSVASVKETHHEYATDMEGKDSERHAAAGANPALLVSGRRTARHRVEAVPPTLAELLATDLAQADVVVVEGYKRSGFPKIEVARAATGREPVAEEDPTVIAVVTDRETQHPSSVPRLALGDVTAAVEFVKRLLAEGI